MNTFLGNATRVAVVMSVTGFAVGLLGCSLSPERRLEVIREEYRELEREAERTRIKGIRLCRGNFECEQRVQREYNEAMTILRQIRNGRIDNELRQAQDGEDAWSQWVRDLTEPAKKLWAPLIELFRKIKDKDIKTNGTLTTNAMRVLSAPDGNAPQSGSDAEPLTQSEAVEIASSMLTTPGSWEQAFRLQISGNVAVEIREGIETTLTQAIFSLSGIYDGELNPGETIGLTGGTVSLFGGTVVVRLSTVVGASQLQVHSNGNGFLRIAGFTDHANEWNDTDFTDEITIKIPVRLQGQSLVVSTDGAFVPGHYFFSRPDDLIADYDGDGYVNSFDIAAFLADFNAADDYADVNGDGSIDQHDVDYFMQEYNRSIAWNQFWADWSTTP